jgi:hypothetical protein
MDDPLRHWEGQARRVRRRRDYTIPRSLTPQTRREQSDQYSIPPRSPPEGFRRSTRKPTTRERIEKLALPLAQGGGARSPEILAL